MSEPLGPGSTFAGCRLEAVAGRGGMGIVYRATQLALQRTVALKAIAPDLAADSAFRERFVRESHLTASIDHPNVIPVYEAGELDGTLYLIMRWVEGTDLATLLQASGRLSPERALTLLRPVASALAAAHARGLTHRDVKPANVLVARGSDENEEHVYLTDFGIARRDDSESLTRTAMFVGTVDYMAPERFQGGKGDAASDIYSLGCVLYETLTGHVPYVRPSNVAAIYAHVADPIPSARDEVADVPERLDAVIATAMAKRPEDRFGSARELAAALGDALQATAPAVTRSEPAETRITPAETRITPADTRQAPADTRLAPADTRLAAASTETAQPPTGAQASRRSPYLLLAPILLLATVGVLVATFSDVHTNSGKPAPSAGTDAKRVTLHGGGMTLGRTIALTSVPGSVSIGKRNLWVSLPDRGELVRTDLQSGARSTFPARGHPTALAAGARALWVAQPALASLGQFNGDSGEQVHAARLRGRPSALALAQDDSTAWIADSSGAISHADVAPTGAGTPAPIIGTPAHTDAVATSIAWGEGWLWATTGAADGLVRVSLDTSGSSTAYHVGTRPVAVAVDQGVWIANGNGHVTRFDPRPGRLRVDADIAVAPTLDAIAATDPSPFVWALSKSRKTIYRLTTAGTPATTGSIAFASPPVALAVSSNSMWVATQDRKVTEIRF